MLESPEEEQPPLTMQHVTDTAVKYLRAKGYTVTEGIGHSIEMSMLLDQLRGMTISNVLNPTLVDDMCTTIDKIKERLHYEPGAK